MNMNECKKFDSCSAPLCPLDRDWRSRKFLPEDRMCSYMLEYSKHGFKGEFGHFLPSEQLVYVASMYNATMGGDSPCAQTIIAKLEKAKKSPSRLDNLNIRRGKS